MVFGFLRKLFGGRAVPAFELPSDGELETTGSGKLRRLAIRQQYLSGTIPVKRG